MISFTGSSRAGRAVGQLAAKHLKRVHLELGGNNALIVLDDVDVEKAVSVGAFGSFMHQGQICMTTGTPPGARRASPISTSKYSRRTPSTRRSATPRPSRSRSARSSTSTNATTSTGS